jgi:hypothetical protein
MSARRSLTVLAATVVASLGVAGAAQAAQTGTVGGVKLTVCTGEDASAITLATHGIACRPARVMAVAAAEDDRWCPKGWSVRQGVRLKGTDVDGPLVQCSRTTAGGRHQSFVFWLPLG